MKVTKKNGRINILIESFNLCRFARSVVKSDKTQNERKSTKESYPRTVLHVFYGGQNHYLNKPVSHTLSR